MISKTHWALLVVLATGCTETQVPVFTRAPSAERFPITVRGGEGAAQYDPALGWSPRGLVIAWCEADGTTQRLLLGAVTDGGTEVLGTVLDFPHSSWSMPTLIERPTGWLLAAQSGPGNVALWFVDPEGHAGPGRDLGGDGYEGHFAGVRLDQGLFAAWTSGINGEYDVWGGFIEEGDGVTPVVDAGSLTPGLAYEFQPSLARVGNEALLAWGRHSSVINNNLDTTWRWVGRDDAGGSRAQVQSQRVAAVGGGSESAVVLWFDDETDAFVGARIALSGALSQTTSLGAGAGQLSAAATAFGDGVLLSFAARRNSRSWLRLVPVAEAGALDGGVWFADGSLGSAREGRPSVSGQWLAFTRFDPDGGSHVQIHPFGSIAVGAPCRTHQECLTGRCSAGACTEALTP